MGLSRLGCRDTTPMRRGIWAQGHRPCALLPGQGLCACRQVLPDWDITATCFLGGVCKGQAGQGASCGQDSGLH